MVWNSVGVTRHRRLNRHRIPQSEPPQHHGHKEPTGLHDGRCVTRSGRDPRSSRDLVQAHLQGRYAKREYIKRVCASRVLVACATTLKFLRVLSGVQRELICLNELPVALSAYDHRIFAAYIGISLLSSCYKTIETLAFSQF